MTKEVLPISIVSIIHGLSALLIIFTAFAIVLLLVFESPAQYYAGRNQCPQQLSTQFDGDDQVLWCPKTKTISNLTLVDQYFGFIGTRYNSTNLDITGAKQYERKISNWKYKPESGYGEHYWTFQLNPKSKVRVQALTSLEFELEIRLNYDVLKTKNSKGVSNNQHQIDYTYEVEDGGRYYFYFNTKSGNNGSVTFNTNETYYVAPSILQKGDPKAVSFCISATRGICNYIFERDESVCVLVYYNMGRSWGSNRCVTYITFGWPLYWLAFAGILFASIFIVLLIPNFILAKLTNPKIKKIDPAQEPLLIDSLNSSS
eukprot:TRINITY_DN4062_c0_g8_i1.p1 TRINITY_DN4062_c0_g8~~TRINITY_DN4062_c0_g8_i1.p1  ORF type:complete len:325 (+),score=119.77 TRINITY_DN4062_c0_g8_i1:28-975(+)